MANRRVQMNPRVGMRTYQQPQQPIGMSYDDLHEGPIHPSQITKNGGALLNFVKGLAGEISATEENERAASGVMFRGDDRRNAYAFRHSKIPHLERVGNSMANFLNEGEMARANQNHLQQTIKVNLNDLLNADKAFANITEGYRKPVFENNYNIEEPKTMTDDDISMYLGGNSTQKRTVPQQSNNTFYVNMDKTTKALLAEQVKTNKLLGILVQSVRENGIKIDELPQHIAELVAATNLPDAEIMNEEEYAASIEQSQEIDETLLP